MSGQAGDTAARPSAGPTTIQYSSSLHWADNYCYNSEKIQEGPPFSKVMLYTREYHIIGTPKGDTIYCSVYKQAGIGIKMRFLAAIHPLHKSLGTTIMFGYNPST